MAVAMMQAVRHQAANNVMLNEIRSGMTVCCQDGAVGRVAGLAHEWAEQPTHVMVQTGWLVPQEVALPLPWVAQVVPDQVVLHVRRRHVERLLPRVTDELLQSDVCDALRNTSTFNVDDSYLSIDVVVHDHVVTLRGNVRTIWRALLAETIARQVRGVWGVQNQIVGDDELRDALLQVLRREHLLRMAALRVEVALGHVTLRGSGATVEQSVAALVAARAVPGVRTINNELVVNARPSLASSPLIDGHTFFANQHARRTGAS